MVMVDGCANHNSAQPGSEWEVLVISTDTGENFEESIVQHFASFRFKAAIRQRHRQGITVETVIQCFLAAPVIVPAASHDML